MGLLSVFFIILSAILLISGVLWLISWLTKPKKQIGLEETITHEEKKTVKTSAILKPVASEPVVQPQERINHDTDDLTIVEGISPEIADLLNQSGVFTFSQLAAIRVISLESILKEANLQIANPSTWPEQAALITEGKWDELQAIQERLKGSQQVD